MFGSLVRLASEAINGAGERGGKVAVDCGLRVPYGMV